MVLTDWDGTFPVYGALHWSVARWDGIRIVFAVRRVGV